MKKLALLACIAGIAALCQTAPAATNFVWNAATTMVYDTNAVNDPTSLSASQFQLNNSAGSLTVNNGSLTLSNTTWGAFIGQNATSAFTNNGGTLKWYAMGANEQRFAIGNGPGGGGGKGTVVMNGGVFEIFAEGTTDTQRNWAVGRDSGTGTLIINEGTIWGHSDRVTIGGWYGADGNFTANGTGKITLGTGAGVLRLSGLNDLTTASFNFNPDGNSYVNFVLGSKGQIEIENATLADYQNWVNNGWMRLDGQITTVDILDYSFDGTYGILKLVDLIASTPVFSPSNVVYAGEAVMASSTATGSGSITYQWQTDDGTGVFSDISGAVSTNLSIDTTGLLGDYQYRMIATSGGNSFTSAPATLTINAAAAPFITADTSPASASRYVGGTITFTAAFDGNHPIGYQWQVDTGSGYVGVPDATNATLTLTNLQFADAGTYRLEASNSQGSNPSTPAALAILDPAGLQFAWSAPVPLSGLIADAILTNTLDGAMGIVGAAVFGNTAPIVVTLSNGRSVTFKNDGTVATATGGGQASGAYPAGTTNTTGNTEFDSVLNQFSYDQGPKTITLFNLVPGETYSVQLFALDNRGGSISDRLASFQDGDDPAISVETSDTFALGDNVYVIGTFTASSSVEVIQENLPTGNAGNINALVVRAVSFSPSLNPPVVLIDPQPKATFEGSPVKFSLVVDSSEPPTYQWQTNGVNVGNGGVFSGVHTDTLTISDAVGLDGVSFSCAVANSAGSTPSASALLTVYAVPPSSGDAAADVLAMNPVAYWPLNELSDASTGTAPIYDASSNGHTGTYGSQSYNAYNGIMGPQPADGYPRFAADQGALNSTPDFVPSWATTPPLDLNTNTVTLGMWIYPDGAQNSSVGLFVNRNSGTQAGLGYYGTDLLGYKWNNDASETWSFISGLVVPTNIWSYVAVVVEPTKATLYLYNTNGLQSAVNVTNHVAMSWGGSQANIFIGRDNNDSRVFRGSMDEVTVFNRALSQAEILSLVGMTAPPSLTIRQSGSDVVVTWSSGLLLEADQIAGPWTTNAAAISPYTNSPAGTQKYFRAVAP